MVAGRPAAAEGEGVSWCGSSAPLTAGGPVAAQLSPESAEEYIEYLKSSDRLDEAAQRLATVVNDERFVSKAGKSNYQVGLWGDGAGQEGLLLCGTQLRLLLLAPQLWHELCDLISQNPDKVQSLNVDAIIRGGLTRFTDQLGKLWCSLADYYIRSGHFEKVSGPGSRCGEGVIAAACGIQMTQAGMCARSKHGHVLLACTPALGLARPESFLAGWP